MVPYTCSALAPQLYLVPNQNGIHIMKFSPDQSFSYACMITPIRVISLSLAAKKWAVTHARSFQAGLASEEVETQGRFEDSVILAWNRSRVFCLRNAKPLRVFSRPSVAKCFSFVRQTRRFVATSGDIATNGHPCYSILPSSIFIILLWSKKHCSRKYLPLKILVQQTGQ